MPYSQFTDKEGNWWPNFHYITTIEGFLNLFIIGIVIASVGINLNIESYGLTIDELLKDTSVYTVNVKIFFIYV